MKQTTQLEQFFTDNNLTFEDITKIYSGVDHACRCGCKGIYYEKNVVKNLHHVFCLACTKTNGSFTTATDKQVDVFDYAQSIAFDLPYANRNTNGKIDWINIPYGNNGKCYCIYFN